MVWTAFGYIPRLPLCVLRVWICRVGNIVRGMAVELVERRNWWSLENAGWSSELQLPKSHLENPQEWEKKETLEITNLHRIYEFT